MEQPLFFLGALEFVLGAGASAAFSTLYRSASARPLGFMLSFSLVFSAVSLLDLAHAYVVQTSGPGPAWLDAAHRGLLAAGASALFAHLSVLPAALGERSRPAWRWAAIGASAIPWVGLFLMPGPIEPWLGGEAAICLLLVSVYVLTRKTRRSHSRVQKTGAVVSLAAVPIVCCEVLYSYGESSYSGLEGLRLWLLAIQVLVLAAIIGRITRPALLSGSERLTDIVLRFRLKQDDQALLELICDALTNKAIAENLNTTEETVKRQVSRLLKKTGVQSRAQLMAMVPTGS